MARWPSRPSCRLRGPARRWGPFARVLALVAFLALPSPAVAYRPFDGTDADLAEPGEIELELGLATLSMEGRTLALHVPFVIFNLGLADWIELVVEGRHEVLLAPPDRRGSAGLADTQASLKVLWRKGSLQGRAGPSLATEFFLSLPELATDGDVPAPSGLGGGAIFILSHELSGWILHVNLEAALTRQQDLGLEASFILELPEIQGSRVRPVFELLGSWDRGEDEVRASLLAGLRWEVSEAASLDLAAVAGWVGAPSRPGPSADTFLAELRAGLTVALPLFPLQGR